MIKVFAFNLLKYFSMLYNPIAVAHLEPCPIEWLSNNTGRNYVPSVRTNDISYIIDTLMILRITFITG